MLSINLLPEEDKRALQTRETVQAIGFFTVLAVLIFGAGVLFGLPSFFATYFITREFERASLIAQGGAEMRTSVRTLLAAAENLRADIEEIGRVTARPSPIPDLFGELASGGDDVMISSLAIRGGADVTLTGQADTRERLLAFERALRSSSRFLDVSFPLGDIVRERDIRFSVTMKLKPPPLP